MRSPVATRISEALFARTNWTESLKSSRTSLSVVIPFYNEEENLHPLHTRLKMVLLSLAPDHEIIFVNDGSRDDSVAKVLEICAKDSRVTLIDFRRNFGKASALAAGFQRAHGDLVLMMDADLQDQPEELYKLTDKMSEGYDLVTGWKRVRHDPIHKTWPSKLFNRTVSKSFGLKLHDFNCGFKVMTSQVAKQLRLYGDFHRFIPVLASDLGYTVAECPIEHAPRMHGISKYGGKRLVTGLLDFWATVVVTKSFHKPMQFFGKLGLRVLALGAIVGLYLAANSLGPEGAHLRPLWMVFAMFVLGGLQILTFGLLGELIVNSLRRSHGNPEIAQPKIINAMVERPNPMVEALTKFYVDEQLMYDAELTEAA
ncbi:MAG TPA: glycosyltransferase family 2 protein [Fimbriimonas sp.]|nr:glycosyltransferase family 2 protein [Fimbriimonas sp.]